MDISEFKSRVDIVRVIEVFLPLRKEGANYKANCPFHSERTASFVVNQNKGYYYCFGCNKGGDAIKFIQDFKNLSFSEAVQEVAKLENIELNFQNDFKKEFNFLSDLNAYFQNNLNDEAKDFFIKRGLNESDIYEFELGFTGELESFIRFLKAKDYLNLAKSLGYIKEKDGRFYSMFLNRLSFVIKDKLGRVRGFSTRELKKSKMGKYINSLASDFFNKSFLLYNLHNAKEYARIQKSLYICEGFFDCIALHKSGFKNAVASCGTAFTNSHLSLIKRLNIEGLKLVFIPDKDTPGYEAVVKALMLCFENEIFNIEVAVCKKSVKDMGEFMQKYQGESVKEHLYYYEGLEFYIKHKLKEAKTADEKHKVFKKLKKLFDELENFYLKNELLEKTSNFLGVSLDAFLKARTKPLEMDNQRQVKELVKTALNDEEFKERVLFYAKEHLKAFEEFFYNDLKAKSLELDENVRIIEKAKQNEALKGFVLSELFKAKRECKNAKEMLELSKKIAKLKSEI